MTPANDNSTDAAWARYCAEVHQKQAAYAKEERHAAWCDARDTDAAADVADALRLRRLLNGRG